MNAAKALKIISATLAILTAAASVAWTAGTSAVAGTKARVEVIEIDHQTMRTQITAAQVAAMNAESLSEYTAKQIQNMIYMQHGYYPPPLPPEAVPGVDGGVKFRPREE